MNPSFSFCITFSVLCCMRFWVAMIFHKVLTLNNIILEGKITLTWAWRTRTIKLLQFYICPPGSFAGLPHIQEQLHRTLCISHHVQVCHWLNNCFQEVKRHVWFHSFEILEIFTWLSREEELQNVYQKTVSGIKSVFFHRFVLVLVRVFVLGTSHFPKHLSVECTNYLKHRIISKTKMMQKLPTCSGECMRMDHAQCHRRDNTDTTLWKWVPLHLATWRGRSM